MTIAKLRQSIAFRLVAFFAATFFAAAVVVLSAAYFLLERSLENELDESLSNEISEYGSLLALQSVAVLDEVLRQEALSEGVDQVFFRLLDSDGMVIIGTDTGSWEGIDPDTELLARAVAGETGFATVARESRGSSGRVVYGPAGGGNVFQFGESMEDVEAVLSLFRRVFLAAAIVLFGAGLLSGGLFTASALASLRRVTVAARRVTAGDWTTRAPISKKGNELDELAAAFNDMIVRLHSLIVQLTHVTDDIAHDLRTPIMRIRGTAEMAIPRWPDNEENANAAGDIIEECDEMLQMINTMLEISQTESGIKSSVMEDVDAAALIRDVCDLFQSASEDKDVSLDVELPDALTLRGDRFKLRRAFGHIVDNAIKYTPAAGTVRVAGRAENGSAVIEISDTGPGIADSEKSRVFDRFYRIDQSRNQSGNGLGLSLALAITRAHGGNVDLLDNEPQGCMFRLRFPGA